ncbi:LuxR C-terminal-related transcriptional regulator [Kitasatospora sp. NPDC094015]|uniref:LuxR C-terminal-related transcriptional regulator n=1 Tax=Kitasatospora sp. NPDC094015 TaxID=3155205 RepID=UPI00333458A3
MTTELHLSRRTVEHHVARAMAELQVASRSDLTRGRTSPAAGPGSRAGADDAAVARCLAPVVGAVGHHREVPHNALPRPTGSSDRAPHHRRNTWPNC